MRLTVILQGSVAAMLVRSEAVQSRTVLATKSRRKVRRTGRTWTLSSFPLRTRADLCALGELIAP